MPVHHSRLAPLAFIPGGHPLESKQVGPDPRVARVRFDVGFEDPHVCQRSHVILVEDGELTLELDGSILTAAAGEVIRITAGTAHRASNQGNVPTTLLIISDLHEIDAYQIDATEDRSHQISATASKPIHDAPVVSAE